MVESNLVIGSTFDTSLQCPICCQYFSIPIFQCDNGHSIWDRCTIKINKCPACRANIGKRLRNFHLEQQLTSIDYRWKFPGWQEEMKLAARIEHEEQCIHNPNLTCILQNCKWQGHKSDLLQHLSSKHKIPHYDIWGNSAEYSSRLRSATLPPTAGWVKLLHTFYLPDNKVTTILTYIFMDSMKNLFFPQFRTFGDAPNKFKLKIWNTDGDGIEEICLTGVARTIKSSLEEERDEKSCVVLDLESLINIYAFNDKTEEGHKLLHYKLSIE